MGQDDKPSWFFQNRFKVSLSGSCLPSCIVICPVFQSFRGERERGIRVFVLKEIRRKYYLFIITKENL